MAIKGIMAGPREMAGRMRPARTRAGARKRPESVDRAKQKDYRSFMGKGMPGSLDKNLKRI